MKYSLQPAYHFFPITGWLNDPNGLIQYKGKYHMFYQFNPANPEWGPMHWGHAISDDLFNWNHLPVALYPEKTFDSNDISGIFSGSAVEKDGKLYLMYTQFFDPKCYENHEKEQQCIAYSDNGITFEKYSKNPVLPHPPSTLFHDFRDPKVWKGEDSNYYCVLGGGGDNVGKILLYSSANLTDWKFENVLIEMDPEEFGPVLECPDFFKLDDRWVLLFSTGFLTEGARKSYYIIGDFRENKFYPADFGEIDLGNDIYAVQTFKDKTDRRILIGWIHTPERYNYTADEGWAGIMSIPRTLHLKNNLLVQTPVEEIKNLIQEEKQPEIKDKTVNIEQFENSFVLEINAIKEACKITLTNSTDSVDISFSSKDLEITETRDTKIEYKDFYQIDSPVKKVTIFVDKTSLEIFINSGEGVCSWRIYPQNIYSELLYENIEQQNLLIKKVAKPL
jgi:beta-fructofuranosidase